MSSDENGSDHRDGELNVKKNTQVSARRTTCLFVRFFFVQRYPIASQDLR